MAVERYREQHNDQQHDQQHDPQRQRERQIAGINAEAGEDEEEY
jgi:hypothetical protein